jgi:hypothetical protein
MIAKARPSKRPLRMECLESRRCLAVSVGWDGPGLGAADLSYYLGDVSANVGLDQATVDAVFEKALDIWASVADVTFTETARANQADSIDFSFRSIDGPGGVLAQAYFPNDRNRGSIAGDVQFDQSETWEVGNSRGRAAFDLLYVTVHELGHALGLDHSTVVGSVMYASVSATTQFVALAAADIVSIQQLYAPAEPTSPPPADQTPTTPNNPTQPTEPVPTNPTPTPPSEPPQTPPNDATPTPPAEPAPESPGRPHHDPPQNSDPSPPAEPAPTPPSIPAPELPNSPPETPPDSEPELPTDTSPETPPDNAPVPRFAPWSFWNWASGNFSRRWWQQSNTDTSPFGTYQITVVNGNGTPVHTFRITIGLPGVRFF